MVTSSQDDDYESHSSARVVVVGSLEPFLLRTKPLHAKEGKAANQGQHTGTATTQPIVLITLLSLFHSAPNNDALCPACCLLPHFFFQLRWLHCLLGVLGWARGRPVPIPTYYLGNSMDAVPSHGHAGWRVALPLERLVPTAGRTSFCGCVPHSSSRNVRPV